jgi:hypothetical protein
MASILTTTPIRNIEKEANKKTLVANGNVSYTVYIYSKFSFLGGLKF